ncbi:MAG TPA: chorismate synthase [Elusimicrobiota bacterium]|nr:chorismate synthase [Elusimicrobiota bacterium]
MIRYMTAGESHGKCLMVILEGIPAGLKVTEEAINKELSRRQHSFGRGERLQYIENDQVEILSGVRWGETLGSPITMKIQNKDWENWKKIMSISEEDRSDKFRLVRPRPGHTDLAGVLKFDRHDTRDILERASARETAARTAAGAVCKRLLEEFGIQVFSFVTEIGGHRAKLGSLSAEDLFKLAEKSSVRCPDKDAEAKMVKAIQQAKADGDTLGGVYTVAVTGCPVGLGSHVQWDLKLTGRLAQALMSIQAHKGVEIGNGFGLAKDKGSDVHDEIFHEAGRGFFRKTNNAGGLEGGITNGEPIVLQAAMKPLASLRRPLKSVNILTKEEMAAEIVRSDVCPVASASIVGEAMAALVIADAMKEKFGGDSVREMSDNHSRYLEYLRQY